MQAKLLSPRGFVTVCCRLSSHNSVVIGIKLGILLDHEDVSSICYMSTVPCNTGESQSHTTFPPTYCILNEGALTLECVSGTQGTCLSHTVGSSCSPFLLTPSQTYCSPVCLYLCVYTGPFSLKGRSLGDERPACLISLSSGLSNELRHTKHLVNVC